MKYVLQKKIIICVLQSEGHRLLIILSTFFFLSLIGHVWQYLLELRRVREVLRTQRYSLHSPKFGRCSFSFCILFFCLVSIYVFVFVLFGFFSKKKGGKKNVEKSSQVKPTATI